MNTPLKTGVLVLIGLLLFATHGAAETRYVTEELTITLRTGPGTDRKIIAFPNAGDELEVLTPGEEYTEVMTHGGKQGFVLTQYLTDKEPARRVLVRLEQKHSQLLAKYEALQNQSSQLSSEGQSLADELARTKIAFEQLSTEHETLKSESKQFLELKTKYEKAVKDATEARSRADNVDSKYQQLANSELMTGLLYGGGLIVLGFITGWILKRPKRRSPLM